MGPILPSREEREQAYRNNRKMLLTNMIFLLLIFVAVTFIVPSKEHRNLFVWNDLDMVITCPDDTVYTIPYADITHIALVEGPDYGICTAGQNDGACRYGRWENDTLGEYILCAYKSFDLLIQINTKDGVYRISYESADTTTGLYNSITETLHAEGYSVETIIP